MLKDVDIKAESIISDIIKPGMSDMEKALALHDYVIANAQYDEEALALYNDNKDIPAESGFAYGVLIKGKGVCQSYAHAIAVLYRKVGIQTIILSGWAYGGSGNGGPHAWNAAKIDGKWGYIDATWDDTVPDIQGRIKHNYFFITAEEIKKTHEIDEAYYSPYMK